MFIMSIVGILNILFVIIVPHFFELERASLFIQMLRNQLGIGFLPMRVAKHYLQKGEF